MIGCCHKVNYTLSALAHSCSKKLILLRPNSLSERPLEVGCLSTSINAGSRRKRPRGISWWIRGDASMVEAGNGLAPSNIDEERAFGVGMIGLRKVGGSMRVVAG